MTATVKLWCRHERVRCVHGDEIIARGYARAACLHCGRSVKHLPLPDLCFYTGKLHPSRKPGGVEPSRGGLR